MITLDTSVQPQQIANIVELYLKNIATLTEKERETMTKYINLLIMDKVAICIFAEKGTELNK